MQKAWLNDAELVSGGKAQRVFNPPMSDVMPPARRVSGHTQRLILTSTNPNVYPQSHEIRPGRV